MKKKGYEYQIEILNNTYYLKFRKVSFFTKMFPYVERTWTITDSCEDFEVSQEWRKTYNTP